MSGWLIAAAAGIVGIFAASLNGGSNAFSCDYQIKNTGNYSTGDGAGGATPDAPWITPTNSTVAALYQVKVDVTSGSFSSGTTGTYLDCSSTNVWIKSGTGSVSFNVTFREKASGIVRKVYSTSITVT